MAGFQFAYDLEAVHDWQAAWWAGFPLVAGHHNGHCWQEGIVGSIPLAHGYHGDLLGFQIAWAGFQHHCVQKWQETWVGYPQLANWTHRAGHHVVQCWQTWAGFQHDHAVQWQEALVGPLQVAHGKHCHEAWAGFPQHAHGSQFQYHTGQNWQAALVGSLQRAHGNH